MIKQKAVISMIFFAVATTSFGTDWPVYMHDNARSGITTEQPEVQTLKDVWSYKSPVPPRTAWAGPAPWDAYNMKHPLPALRNFDNAFFVTVIGDSLYFGSSVDDSVHCLSIYTGQEKWFFRTDGPVRFPPAYYNGKLYFGSDDGYAYCVSTNGDLVWKYTPVPESERRLIANNNSAISLWPIRTGIVIEGGNAYFAAGIVSWKPSKLCAVNADTGAEVYSVAGGTTPMGAILATSDNLYISQGRLAPRMFNRVNGADLGAFANATSKAGSYALLTPSGEYIHGMGDRQRSGDNGLYAYNSTNKAAVTMAYAANARKMVVTTNISYVLYEDSLAAVDNTSSSIVWQVACDTPDSLILAGNLLFTGGDNKVKAWNTSDGSQVWQHTVNGRIEGLAVAHGLLFISSDDGCIYALGSIGPGIYNGGVSSITATSATLSGNLTSSDGGLCTVGLAWGTQNGGTDSNAWQNTAVVGSYTGGVFSAQLSGLTPDSGYYYSFYAQDTNGIVSWGDPAGTFITGEININATDNSAAEEGPDTASITVSRPTDCTNVPVTVNLTFSGTAINGADYIAIPSTIKLPIGTTTTNITLTPIDDLLKEDTETATITVSNGAYRVGSPAFTSVTITDNDVLDPYSFTHRLRINFSGYTRPETLDNFPALVVVNESITGFSYSDCKPDGSDIRFTTADKSAILPYEIEDWNTNGDSHVWVMVPQLNSGGSAVWMYWGNSSAGAPPPPELTWQSNFMGVWHMDATNAPDSIGTANGIAHGNISTGGIVGTAQAFNGNHQYMKLGSAADIRYGDNINFSVELWVKTSGWNNDAAMISNKDWNSGGNPGWVIAGGANNNGSMQWNFCGKNGGRADYDPSVSEIRINDNQWHYICVTHNRAGNAVFYVDGVKKAERDISSSQGSADAGYPTVIATDGALGSVWAYYFAGDFDEVRISSTLLSSNRVWAIYTNITNPTNFCAYDSLYVDSDLDGMEDSWESDHFGSPANANRSSDHDGDGLSDFGEYIAGTDPTNAASCLQFDEPVAITPHKITIRWYSVSNRVYNLKKNAELTGGDWQTVANGIPATPPLNSREVNLDSTNRPAFFSISVEEQ